MINTISCVSLRRRMLMGFMISNYYGIVCREEAVAYLAHEVLGERLRRVCHILLEQVSAGKDAILLNENNFISLQRQFPPRFPLNSVPGWNFCFLYNLWTIQKVL